MGNQWPGYRPITEVDGWFIGEDVSLDFEVTKGDHTAADITGWTLDFKVAATEGGTSIEALEKTATVTSGTAGLCSVAIDDEDTDGLDGGTYFYQLARTDSGFEKVVAEGPALIKARIV